MCVIVHQPPEVTLDDERLRRLWKHNSHGGGIAYITPNNEIKVHKSMDLEKYLHTYKSLRGKFAKTDFLLHMRIATHGTVDLSNVHPFHVNEHTVMAHNGIIHGVPTDKERSDTRVFVEDVLPSLPTTWLDDFYIRQMVEKWIGWSKLMFLTVDPALKHNVYILNRKSGTDHEGLWFSNSAGLHPPSKSMFGGGKDHWTPGQYWTDYGSATPLQSKKGGKKDKKKKGSSEASLIERAVKNRTLAPAVSTPRAMGPGLLREIQERRRRNGFVKPILWSGKYGSYFCQSCLALVATGDIKGACACYDRVCISCIKFAGDCSCRGTAGIPKETQTIEEYAAKHSMSEHTLLQQLIDYPFTY